jgi:hypothetical protein
MGSKHSFNHRELKVLDEAFKAAWAVVQAQHPFRDVRKDEELQAGLRRKLFALAKAGLCDPELLRNLALEITPYPSPSRSPPWSRQRALRDRPR